MMTKKDKFNLLVSTKKTNTLERNRERIKNRAMIRESQKIALKVLMKLDDWGWSQKRLAEEMQVSPQQINKIVRGKENLTLETQTKLQALLDIPILASYYEKEEKEEEVTVSNDVGYIIPVKSENDDGDSLAPILQMNIDYPKQLYK